jgi:ribonuclease D
MTSKNDDDWIIMPTLITTQDALNVLAAQLTEQAFITIDTEFLREKTYYPMLCLVQVAAGDGTVAAAIDPLIDGLDLAPLYSVLKNAQIIKVFHAARQDLEIFYELMGELPHNVYDTQIAAAACGYGDQVGYENLIGKVLGRSIDKSQQFTDWSRRPLSDAQLVYALADVTHLRDAYIKLDAQIKKLGRETWVGDDLARLTDEAIYVAKVEDAWNRLKKRQFKPYYLARLKAVATWREAHAKAKNKPRSWILHDDAVQEIAMTNPQTLDALKAVRALKKAGVMDAQGLIDVIAAANALDKEACPQVEQPEPFPEELEPARDLLKLLLRRQANEHRVVPRMVADSEALRFLLEGKRDLPCLQGWRYDVFGRHAIDLLEGRVTVRLQNQGRDVMFEVQA